MVSKMTAAVVIWIGFIIFDNSAGSDGFADDVVIWIGFIIFDNNLPDLYSDPWVVIWIGFIIFDNQVDLAGLADGLWFE